MVHRHTPRITVAAALAATLAVGGAGMALASNTVEQNSFVQPCGHPYTVACQNLRTICAGSGFVDADGDGICDNGAQDNGIGCTDANNDGVCDAWAERGGSQRRCGDGMGKGFQRGYGHGARR